MPVTIRPAQGADETSVLTLAKAFATSFVVAEGAFHSAYVALLASPESYLAVAEADRQVVGYLLGFDHETFYANGRVAWIEELMGSAIYFRKVL